MASERLETPIGPITVVTNRSGVACVWFGDVDDEAADTSDAAERHLTQATEELVAYFDGERERFDVPLDRSTRRGFRGEVLEALEAVPFGATITYGALAAHAGRPKAARAVGSAMATNPIAILVPCHRVIPSTGGLGQFGGGVRAKEWLLRREGILD